MLGKRPFQVIKADVRKVEIRTLITGATTITALRLNPKIRPTAPFCDEQHVYFTNTIGSVLTLYFGEFRLLAIR